MSSLRSRHYLDTDEVVRPGIHPAFPLTEFELNAIRERKEADLRDTINWIIYDTLVDSELTDKLLALSKETLEERLVLTLKVALKSTVKEPFSDPDEVESPSKSV